MNLVDLLNNLLSVDMASENGVEASESEEVLRNPSPPPDVDSLLPDKIGNTTFSKRAVLATLMHVTSLVHERSITSQSNSQATALSSSRGNSVHKLASADSTPKIGLCLASAKVNCE